MYHIMNRGRRSEVIFSGKEDFQIFIALLEETEEMWNIRISAYCLMPNHYHLLLQTPDVNISRGMRHINGGMYNLRCPAGWFEENTKGDVQRASQCSGLSDSKDQVRSFKGDWRAVWNRKILFGEQHDRRDQTADENRSKLQKTHQWSVSFDY